MDDPDNDSDTDCSFTNLIEWAENTAKTAHCLSDGSGSEDKYVLHSSYNNEDEESDDINEYILRNEI